MTRPTSVLICHHDEPLNRDAMPRWLNSWSDVGAVIVIREESSRMKRRIKREIERIGLLRFLDVVAFRFYYKLRVAGTDHRKEQDLLTRLEREFPALPPGTRIVETASPNSAEVAALLKEVAPDFMIARCKTILKASIFEAPSKGTYVIHPGICPEYRNSHGCFWALVRRDLGRVGATLLRVDAGIDTGATFGYYTYAYDERNDSHIVIQDRVVFDNLAAIRDKLLEVLAGTAQPIDVSGRESRAWGQPWLTAWLRWKRAARAAA